MRRSAEEQKLGRAGKGPLSLETLAGRPAWKLGRKRERRVLYLVEILTKNEKGSNAFGSCLGKGREKGNKRKVFVLNLYTISLTMCVVRVIYIICTARCPNWLP